MFYQNLYSLRTADVSPRSSLLRDVSRGGTSAIQRQKFHTDDVNQCLLNKSGSHGVPNANLLNFTFLLVDFGKVLCSSANELQQNSNASSRKDYIPKMLTVLSEIHRVYIWPLPPFVFCLSFVINSYCVDQLALLTGFRTDLRHQYGVTDVPPSETSLSGDERGESSAVPRLKRIEICMETPCWFPPGWACHVKTNNSERGPWR